MVEAQQGSWFVRNLENRTAVHGGRCPEQMRLMGRGLVSLAHVRNAGAQQEARNHAAPSEEAHVPTPGYHSCHPPWCPQALSPPTTGLPGYWGCWDPPRCSQISGSRQGGRLRSSSLRSPWASANPNSYPPPAQSLPGGLDQERRGARTASWPSWLLLWAWISAPSQVGKKQKEKLN